jgi:rhodanese-related sulfurtransferase
VFLFRNRISSNSSQQARAVDVHEALRRQVAGALLVDVRELDEWAAGHAGGACHLPLGQLGARQHELPRDREILLICRSGRRSTQAAGVLLHAGHSPVTNVIGGMQAWARAGLPTGR